MATPVYATSAFRFSCCPISFPGIKPIDEAGNGVAVEENRLYAVFFSWEGEDHWREVRAPSFEEAIAEARRTVEFPKGLDSYTLGIASGDGASHSVLVPIERGETDHDSF